MKPRPEKTEFAHKLRLRPTDAERKLWEVLRRKSLGFRTHRQKVKYGYILDFYVPKCSLAIEVDGDTHDPMKDGIRDGHLRLRGIRTVRVTNEFVFKSSPRELLEFFAVAVKSLEGKGSEAGS